MQKSRFRQLDLSEDVTEFFDDFELEKVSSGISLLEFFQLKGILFNPSKIEDSEEKIEELRVTGNPKQTIIMSLVCGLGVIVLGIIIAAVIAIEDFAIVVVMLGFLIGATIIFFGIRNALTNVIVYSDRLVFRKLLGGAKVYWHEIRSIDVRSKVQITKQKNFWGVYKETGRKTVGVILDIYMVDKKVSLDLEAYGLQSGQYILKKIFDYMIYFNPKIQFPSRDDRNQIQQAITNAYAQINSNPSKAFELAIGLLVLDDRDPNIWKILALLITNIMPEEAFPFIETALSLVPKDADLWNAKGLVYEHLGGNDLALEAYGQAIAIEPRHTFADNNLRRLTGQDPIPNIQPIQFVMPTSEVHSMEALPKIEIKVTVKDIKQIEKIIGKQDRISVAHLIKLTGLYKSKIIKIATEHLHFILEGDVLVKDPEALIKEQKVKVERVKHIIESQKDVPLGYLEIVLKLPRDVIIDIVKNELGYKIIDNKVIK